MNKTIIVSNRLPLQIKKSNGSIEVKPSVGGLATGLKSVHAEGNGIWVGWSGLTEEELLGLDNTKKQKVTNAISKEKCASVSLTQKDIDAYYYGFSNRTLWPLLHYFLEYTEFDNEQWQTYKAVNAKFAKTVLEHIEDGDTVWVHDYQLLLLPKLIKDKKPNVSIGFFLHIPFPSYEILRVFPWREALLEGMLGADLIGFHTYDYERHFLSAIKRILKLEVNFNEITYQDRIIKVDSFPMGIDFEKFHQAALEHEKLPTEAQTELNLRLKEHHKTAPDAKIILSIDRMDYTKGIPNRIKAFEYFLEKYPQFKEKVRLIMLAVPSRSMVPQYQRLKSETDELVGRINGKFAAVNWTPIWYFYRSMPFNNLIDLYTSAHVALITPLRDGMNLVAKEYIATRTNDDGVLILSEMAGAANEMNEALLINPNNYEEVANTIKQALEMPLEEQRARNKTLKERLARYNVEKWANEFMTSLQATNKIREAIVVKKLNKNIKKELLKKFNTAKKRMLFLDYDGTLVGFKNNPQNASPDKNLYQLVDKLTNIPNTEVTIISGRDRETLSKWFNQSNCNLITDHGVWLKQNGSDWETLEQLKNNWMTNILPVLETFVDRTPGSFVERKNYSLAWHYRRVDPELGQKRTAELKDVLTSLIENNELTVLDGNKVLEIKSSNVNKGRAANRLLANKTYDFIMAIGDDWTDEYMFEALPKAAETIKVGYKKTKAKYYIKNTAEVRNLLDNFIK